MSSSSNAWNILTQKHTACAQFHRHRHTHSVLVCAHEGWRARNADVRQRCTYRLRDREEAVECTVPEVSVYVTDDTCGRDTLRLSSSMGGLDVLPTMDCNKHAPSYALRFTWMLATPGAQCMRVHTYPPSMYKQGANMRMYTLCRCYVWGPWAGKHAVMHVSCRPCPPAAAARGLLSLSRVDSAAV